MGATCDVSCPRPSPPPCLCTSHLFVPDFNFLLGLCCTSSLRCQFRPDNPSFDFTAAGIWCIARFTGTEMWRPTLRQVQILASRTLNSGRLSTFHIFSKVQGSWPDTQAPPRSHPKPPSSSLTFPKPVPQCGLCLGSCNPPCGRTPPTFP